MYFICFLSNINIFNENRTDTYLCQELSIFMYGATLAQNFPKLAQLCDLHGKSPIEGLTGADCRQAACNGGAFLPDGNGTANGTHEG